MTNENKKQFVEQEPFIGANSDGHNKLDLAKHIFLICFKSFISFTLSSKLNLSLNINCRTGTFELARYVTRPK